LREKDKKIDVAIRSALKLKPLGHRELKRKIESHEFLERALSDETFNEHLKQMRKENRITALNKATWKLGQKLLLCLTDKEHEEIRLKTVETKLKKV
jgi:hypothetical protein